MRPPAIAIASLLAAPANALPECPPNRAGADLSGVDLFNAKPVNADLAVAELTPAQMEGAIGRELSWERDDITLQNIQARARAPSAWMLANIQNALLPATSNRSEAAVGHATAVAAATEALDHLQPTAASHDRVMVLEVMGRDAGHIALSAGIAGGADAILIPETRRGFPPAPVARSGDQVRMTLRLQLCDHVPQP